MLFLRCCSLCSLIPVFDICKFYIVYISATHIRFVVFAGKTNVYYFIFLSFINLVLLLNQMQTLSFRHQGEAKSAQLIGQAIANNPAFIALRRIEASKEISRTVAASTNKVYLNSDELLLNLQDLNSPKNG